VRQRLEQRVEHGIHAQVLGKRKGSLPKSFGFCAGTFGFGTRGLRR
jgi:hypothetical protein